MGPWWSPDGVDIDRLVAVAVTGAAVTLVLGVRGEVSDGEVEQLAMEVVWPAWSSWSCALPRSFRPRRVLSRLESPDGVGLCRCAEAGKVSPGELVIAGINEGQWVVVRDVVGSPPTARVWAIDEHPFQAYLPLAGEGFLVRPVDADAVLWAALETASRSRRLPSALTAASERSAFAQNVTRVLRASGWLLCDLPPDYESDLRRLV